ncbi:hypothetical protein NPIL_337211, partial [Nephila pilipes]
KSDAMQDDSFCVMSPGFRIQNDGAQKPPSLNIICLNLAVSVRLARTCSIHDELFQLSEHDAAVSSVKGGTTQYLVDERNGIWLNTAYKQHF